MTNDADAQILQVFRRQVWQHLLVNGILAECPLVLFEGQGLGATRSDIDRRAPADGRGRPPLFAFAYSLKTPQKMANTTSSRYKRLKSLALPRGLEPLFSP